MVISEMGAPDSDGWASFLIVADYDWVEPVGDETLGLMTFEPFSRMPVGTLVSLRNFEYTRPGIFSGRYRMTGVN